MTDKLKIGILDLLTILLPGGFLIICLSQIEWLSGVFTGFFPSNINADWLIVVIYIGTSYIFGHFIYFVASFLDGWIYENVKKVFWNDHRLTAYIIKLKSEKTGIDDGKIINAFKWSCAWLLINKPAMYAEVERHIAESKFFRSLVVVSFILFIISLFPIKVLSIFLFFLTFLSLICYLKQRHKSIETAYHYIITASKTAFNKEPDAEKVLELRGYDIEDSSPDKLSQYEIRRSKIIASDLRSFGRKLKKVLNLCLNPFYTSDIVPRGAPLFKSKEIRWFFKEENQNMKAWFERNMKNREAEIRTDIYYVKTGMENISIKFRDKKYEIKQQIPNSKIRKLTPAVQGKLEDWNKWILGDNDADVLRKMLEIKKYAVINIKKERWAVKITFNSDKSWDIHDVKEKLDGACQLEYTRITNNNKVWSTFAAEWFGNQFIEPDNIKRLGLLDSSRLLLEESFSYSKFLSNIFFDMQLDTSPKDQ